MYLLHGAAYNMLWTKYVWHPSNTCKIAVWVCSSWRKDYTHNFIHLLKRQHNYMQKNESENLTNQQHKTLKRYLAQSAQWRHIMFSEAENFCRNLHFLLLTETDGNGQLNISMQHAAGGLLWLSFENFHKCSDNSIIQGLEVNRFQRTCL